MGVEIVTERLRLRPLAPADAPRLRALAGDLAVSRWRARVPHPYPEARDLAHIDTALPRAVWEASL